MSWIPQEHAGERCSWAQGHSSTPGQGSQSEIGWTSMLGKILTKITLSAGKGEQSTPFQLPVAGSFISRSSRGKCRRKPALWGLVSSREISKNRQALKARKKAKKKGKEKPAGPGQLAARPPVALWSRGSRWGATEPPGNHGGWQNQLERVCPGLILSHLQWRLILEIKADTMQKAIRAVRGAETCVVWAPIEILS